MRNARLGEAAVIPVILGLGVVWGLAFILIKVLVEDLSPTEIAAGRLPLAALTVLVVAAVVRARFPSTPRVLAGIAVMAMLDTVIPYTLVGWAETRIDGGIAAVIMSTMPLFTVIFAAVLLSEGVRGTQLAGIAIGFVGVAVVAQLDSLTLTSGAMLGNLAIVAAAASNALAVIVARQLLRTEDPVGLTGMKLVIASLVALPLSFGFDGVPAYTGLDGQGWAALVTLGVVSTGVAFTAFIWLVLKAGSVQASLATYVIPVAGLGIGWLALGETIEGQTYLGVPLIAAGLAIARFDVELGRALRALQIRAVELPCSPPLARLPLPGAMRRCAIQPSAAVAS